MDIQKLIDDYFAWLKSEITFSKIGEYYEITTPYLNNENDYLQIYVRQKDDTIFFSDDGATISNLEMHGFQFTPARKKHLDYILSQYGIKRNGAELQAEANAQNFANKKHMFIQAMLRVDDMFYMSKSRVASLFLDDIQSFFDKKDIFYTDNVQFAGKSGFMHNYDFLLQRSRTNPERLCRAINNPSKSNMSNVLFAWHDTKPSRKQDSKLIVILNDQDSIPRGVTEGFQSYNASVIKWSERNNPKNLKMLSA